MNQRQQIESIQVAKISASSIVLYNKQLETRARTTLQLENEKNLRDQEYNGYMSPKTKCKVRKMLDAWITAVEVKRKELGQANYYRNSKVTFITLTLSAKQDHSDNYIKRNLLNRFIIEAKRDWEVYNYFWRAEPQKNGNIHFHILVDKYIPHQQVREKWNSIQNSHGYIDKFYKKTGHRNPNSTDIKGLENIKSMQAYVVKYCCKVEAKRKIDGRIWGSSDSLKRIGAYEVEVSNEVYKYIEEVEKLKSTKVVVKEDFTLIFCNNEKALKSLSMNLYRDWKLHYASIFDRLYTSEGRKKDEEIAAREKDLLRHSAPTNRLPINDRSRVLVGSQLPLFATANWATSR